MSVMLSIGAMKSGQVDYYQRLAREDYYLEGGEPPGEWIGSGAKTIGLDGRVKARDLSAHFLGFSSSGRKLVQNAGKASRRQPGWDLTFSAPKSVSVLWSQCDKKEKRLIQEAHAASVKSAIEYLERVAAFSRLGQGGTEQVKVGLVVAAFEHSCSRALDPQLHTHCLVLNLGVDANGQTRSILSKPFYNAKMLAGALYRCDLAQRLQASLGVDIERPLDPKGRPVSWFEVKGVPKSILSYFSKRRAAIEAELGSRGMDSASAAAFAALSTRETKAIVPPRNELHARWKEEGVSFKFQPELLFKKTKQQASEKNKQFERAVSEVIDELTFSQNFFGTNELTRRVLEASQGLGLCATKVVDSIEKTLRDESPLISLGTHKGETQWTTKEVLELEEKFLKAVTVLRQREFVPVADGIVAKALQKVRGSGANRYRLDEEQQSAVRYITQGKKSLKVVSGFAGTGKTDMLAAAKQALERSGYRVIGTALAGVAARSLQEKTGIKSETIRKRELQLGPGLAHALKHHAKQLTRAARGMSTEKLSRLTIDAKTVLVIDEAGMVGTRDFALLASAVVKQGGSIVAIGDERQLPSIERGGCFAKLVADIDGVRLNEIRRQECEGDQAAVKHAAFGNAETVLNHYAEKGQLFVGRNRSQAEEQLVCDWTQNGGAANPSEHRIFAGTRVQVDRFNKLCQWERVRAGEVEVDAGNYVEHDGTSFMVGDRVRFTINERTRGILKGQRGTVVACRTSSFGKYVAVDCRESREKLQQRIITAAKHHGTQLINAALGRPTKPLPKTDRIVVVPLQSWNPMKRPYKGLSLDYAMTTHLGQGQTVDNSYVLLGGTMTGQQLTYVQTSRHKKNLFLYAEQNEAGNSITELARKTRQLPEFLPPQMDDMPDYSLLSMQMKLSQANELAVSVKQDPSPQSQELEHARR